jgi:hypothetical protein
MLTSERVLTALTAAVYVAALVAAYMDLFVWRP